jgi:hypothetical protein
MAWRAYLTYLVQKLFSIQRYKNRPERDFPTDEPFYSQLNDRHYEESLAELERIYKYTQSYIRSEYFSNRYSKYLTKTGYIKIARGVRNNGSEPYASNIVYLKDEAEQKGTPFVEVETDIVTFYAIRPYGEELVFYVETPFEDILIYDKAVTLQDLCTPYREGEFIVINRNPKGIVQIEIKDIKYDPTRIKPIEPRYSNRYRFYLTDQNITILQRGKLGTILDFIGKVFGYFDKEKIILVLFLLIIFIVFYFR